MSSASHSGAKRSARSKRALPATDADAERRVQPRRSHTGPNPPAAAAAASSKGAAEVEGSPPAARLHRHALESIFRFLGRGELVTALQVSRDWLASAKSMASLELTVEEPPAPLAAMAESVMGRHVVCLGSNCRPLKVTADSLSLLAGRMPQLRELYCEMKLVRMAPTRGAAPLTFPAALRSLDVDLIAGPGSVAGVNAVLQAVGRLPLLESFDTRLPIVGDKISFAPLASLPQLRDLLICAPQDGAELSDAQVDQLRAMPHLRKVYVSPMETPLLRRLLRQPHALQWQVVDLPLPLDDEGAALVSGLPSLTQIDVVLTCPHFDWLRGLPNLVEVRLDGREFAAGPTNIESLVGALQQCGGRVERLLLKFFEELTTAHLRQLLPHLPRLQELDLGMAGIDSLSFLAQGPVTSSLHTLRLSGCSLSVKELRHVHALRALKVLELDETLTSSLDEHCRWLYTPPSLALPQLEEFTYIDPSADEWGGKDGGECEWGAEEDGDGGDEEDGEDPDGGESDEENNEEENEDEEEEDEDGAGDQ